MPLLPLLSLTLACQDYKVAALDAGDAPGPHLVVDPGHLVFPDTVPGVTSSMTLTLQNEGDAALDLTDVTFVGSSGFRLADDLPPQIPAGGTVQVQVLHTPVDPDDEGQLLLSSNDPTHGIWPVDLSGRGLFPTLSISPDPYDFGTMYAGCAEKRDFDLTNTGDAPLTVDGIAHVGAAFYLANAPETPFVLAPGETQKVTVGFQASIGGDWTGSLYVSSDEPGGVRQASQTAKTLPPIEGEEKFQQPTGDGRTDILLFVDKSGSMADDQANLQANFKQLTDTLDGLSGDWQIAVVVNEDGCHAGDFITPVTKDKQAALESALGAYGYSEAGLGVTLKALQATGRGQCNEGFAREGADVAAVLVSDEHEQSGTDWSTLVDDIETLAPTTVSAIAGDVPDGCATAEAGTGYYEATGATGGVFLSICGDDWGTKLETVGNAVIRQATDTFVLTGSPLPETLVVTVDGVLAGDWSWDATQNAVVFDEMPAPGAIIDVKYQGAPHCDG